MFSMSCPGWLFELKTINSHKCGNDGCKSLSEGKADREEYGKTTYVLKTSRALIKARSNILSIHIFDFS